MRVPGTWPVLGVCAALVLSGLAAVRHGFSLPVYTDHALASQIKLSVCEPGGASADWYERLQALSTLRHEYVQAGASAVLVAASLAALYFTFRGSDGAGYTPAKRSTYLWLGALAVGIEFVAQVHSAELDLARGDWIPCGPTAALGMISIVIFSFVALVAAVGLGFLITRNLPAGSVPLFALNGRQAVESWPTTFLFLALGALCIWVMVEQATSSQYLAQPANVIFLYIFAATRAALSVSNGPDREAEA